MIYAKTTDKDCPHSDSGIRARARISEPTPSGKLGSALIEWKPTYSVILLVPKRTHLEHQVDPRTYHLFILLKPPSDNTFANDTHAGRMGRLEAGMIHQQECRRCEDQDRAIARVIRLASRVRVPQHDTTER